jgi:DUF218 domain
MKDARRNNQQLPSSDTVKEMVQNLESIWPRYNFDFFAKFPSLLMPFNQLIEIATLDNIFNVDMGAPDPIDCHLARCEEFKVEASEFIVEHPEQFNLYSQIYDALAAQDPPEKVDLLFVFGSPSNARSAKALSLYQNGMAPKIMVTGRGPNYRKDSAITEGARTAEFLVAAGVPTESVITEEQSINLPDNVKRGIEILSDKDLQPKKVGVVSSEFALLRCWKNWFGFANWPLEILKFAPPVQDPKLGRELWHTNPKGIDIILNEYCKMSIEDLVGQSNFSRSSNLHAIIEAL